jgi:hypothetical protein
MNPTTKMPGIRCNAPTAVLLQVYPGAKALKGRSRFYTYWTGGKGNKAARRIIPLLVPGKTGDTLTCEWLQRLKDAPDKMKRYSRDGWSIIRARDLMHEGEPPPKPKPGLHGATETHPVLVMTVKKSDEGHFIRLDLYLGADEFETLDFVPKDFDLILVESAGPQPGIGKMECWEAELQRDGADAQHGQGSPLYECFYAALAYAERSFGLSSGGRSAERMVSGFPDGPSAHPLQRRVHCENSWSYYGNKPEQRHPKDRRHPAR